MDNLLEMRGIRKSFYGVEVLHGVDFSVRAGEVMALCGENGAGKSTLMKILTGIYSRDAGEVLFEGAPVEHTNPLKSTERGIVMIHQELNLADNLSVAQNIFLGREPRNRFGLVDHGRMHRDAAALMEQLREHIDPATPVGELKVAQKQIVEIAKAISARCKLIVMDEPTAVLTERETGVLFELIGRFAQQGIAVIYISHRLAEVKQICDRVTILRDGELITTREVSGTDVREIANLMVGREVQESTAADYDGAEDDVVLEVRGVSDRLLQNVSFSVRRGEILGFSGLVGAGRTELMEFVFGLRRAREGEILLHGRKRIIRSPSAAIRHNIAFATEDRKQTGIVPIRSIGENMNYVYLQKSVRFTLPMRKLARNNREMIDRLNIVCTGSDQPIANLSGGNQQKVILAKWLLIDADILILDEPTRGIDVGAREEIYQIINDVAASGKTVIIVSSDLQEILTVCHRVIVMYEGRVTGELTGAQRTEENIMALASDIRLPGGGNQS